MDEDELIYELINKYPGLWEEFRKWYVETSLAFNEPSDWQQDSVVSNMYSVFIRGNNGFVFFKHEDLLPPPPHILAMRDRSLA